MDWRILAVDDSSVARSYLRRVLTVSGFPVKEFLQAGDGVDAVEILKTHTVDLVISDINMPRMDGEALIRWIRSQESLKALPIIVVSTDSSTARHERLSDLGVSGYVSKPYSPESLRSEMERALEVDHEYSTD